MSVSTSQTPPPKRVRSARGYAAYAADIGISERTIKRWVARGKIVGEPFPLDALEGAVDWWARHQRNSAPAELVHAAAQAKRAKESGEVGNFAPANGPKGKGSAGEAAAAGDATAGAPPAAPASSSATSPAASSAATAAGTPPGTEPGKPLLAGADMVAGTIEENLRRLHVIHSANLTLLEQAYGGSNEADVINRQRNAQRSGEMLNAAQRAFDEYQRARGDVVPIADVKRDLLRIHAAMAQSLVSIIEDLGIPHARAMTAADGWFRMLHQSDFFADTAPPLQPAPAPAPAAPAVSAPAPAPQP